MISEPSHVYTNSTSQVAGKYVNLFEFSDYRKYLAAYQAARQVSDASFSRSQFCKEIGLPNTRSYFSDIIRGTRNLSKAYVNRFIQAISMTEEEAKYFRILVYFGQSTYEKEVLEVLGENLSLKKWRRTAAYVELSNRINSRSLKWFLVRKSGDASSPADRPLLSREKTVQEN